MELYRRENYLKKIRGFYHASDIIKVITGVRRCGKSSLMQMIAEELRDDGTENSQIIFLNLDKRGYRKIKTADQLDELIASFPKATGMTYLFIDEIQNVKDFEDVINAYREEGDYSIFITGSNSYLLSGELVTKLTGRYVELEMFPLTFDEYLGMKVFYGKPVDANLSIELNRYILEGGFPRTVLLDELADKRSYTQSVVSEIFEKDIRKRTKIKDKEAFEAVRHFIINNFGATTSISSLHEALVKNGMNITRSTVTKYISILVNAKLLYECDRFDMKSKRALKGEKKYYLSDLSFYFCDNTDNRINYGPVLENITYFYAKSRGYSVSVGRIGTLECDFILRNRDADYAYLQVAYTIAQSKETEDREYRALEKIKDNYPKYLLTTDYLLQKRSGIRHVNLMDFMETGSEF
jgi:predicted AAA+ superfamily ATPase